MHELLPTHAPNPMAFLQVLAHCDETMSELLKAQARAELTAGKLEKQSGSSAQKILQLAICNMSCN